MPCAMLMMSSTPKISVSPTAISAYTPPASIPSMIARKSWCPMSAPCRSVHQTVGQPHQLRPASPVCGQPSRLRSASPVCGQPSRLRSASPVGLGEKDLARAGRPHREHLRVVAVLPLEDEDHGLHVHP